MPAALWYALSCVGIYGTIPIFFRNGCAASWSLAALRVQRGFYVRFVPVLFDVLLLRIFLLRSPVADAVILFRRRRFRRSRSLVRSTMYAAALARLYARVPLLRAVMYSPPAMLLACLRRDGGQNGLILLCRSMTWYAYERWGGTVWDIHFSGLPIRASSLAFSEHACGMTSGCAIWACCYRRAVDNAVSFRLACCSTLFARTGPLAANARASP